MLIKTRGRLIVMATRVFADVDQAETWLRSPNRQLNQRTPLDALSTREGARLVERQLQWYASEKAGRSARGPKVRAGDQRSPREHRAEVGLGA